MKLQLPDHAYNDVFFDYVLHGHPYPALVASEDGILLAVNDAATQFANGQCLPGRSLQDVGIDASLVVPLDETWKTLRIVLQYATQHCAYRTMGRKMGTTMMLICTAQLDVSNHVLQEMTSLNNELVNMTRELRSRNEALEQARCEIRDLRQLLPMCAGCNSIRDEAGQWHPVAEYLIEHTDTKVTHGLCPACISRYYGDSSAT